MRDSGSRRQAQRRRIPAAIESRDAEVLWSRPRLAAQPRAAVAPDPQYFVTEGLRSGWGDDAGCGPHHSDPHPVGLRKELALHQFLRFPAYRAAELQIGALAGRRAFWPAGTTGIADRTHSTVSETARVHRQYAADALRR